MLITSDDIRVGLYFASHTTYGGSVDLVIDPAIRNFGEPLSLTVAAAELLLDNLSVNVAMARRMAENASKC